MLTDVTLIINLPRFIISIHEPINCAWVQTSGCMGLSVKIVNTIRENSIFKNEGFGFRVENNLTKCIIIWKV